MRERIVTAATHLLVEGGRDAVSTRAVCSAAQVQAPTIYRLFGDKQGLLDAVAAHGFASYVAATDGLIPTADPVTDLRRGWDAHVAFGLANPFMYSLAFGGGNPGTTTAVAASSAKMLTGHVHRVAVAGRLRVPEATAVTLLHAAGCGTTLALIATPEEHRDLAASVRAREMTIDAVTTDAGPEGDGRRAAAAVRLWSLLPARDALTATENSMLGEWLDRIARAEG